MKEDSLLNRALASALESSNCELKIITSGANDLSSLIAETSKLKPDIVIIGESMPLAGKDVLGSLLMSYPEMRVVVVSEDSNWLHVFHKKDKLMTRNADLLDVLCLD
jgi:DNA-binding NarL/FixJ family response regulator